MAGTGPPNSSSDDRVRNRRSFKCRYLSLLRACAANNQTLVEALRRKNGKANSDARHAIENGEPLDERFYLDLGAKLGVEPTSLYYPKGPLPPQPSDRSKAFADRIRELINAGTIPRLDDGGRPVDVVEYVWQLQDPEIDRLEITMPQQRDGFLLLVTGPDPVLVEERIPRFGNRTGRIGALRIAPPTCDQISADFEDRRYRATVAFQDLKDDLDVETGRIGQWVQDCRVDFQTTFQMYLQAEAIHRASWPLSAEHLDDVILTDRNCRETVYRPGPARDGFVAAYNRSWGLIREWKRSAPDDFRKNWLQYLKRNTDRLRLAVNALMRTPPDFDAMLKATEDCIDDAQKKAFELYPDL